MLKNILLLVFLACEFVSAQRHEAFKVQVRDASIASELFLPPGKGPFPLVVVLPGSGDDHKEMREKIRAKFRDPLLSGGLAVVFYDNPGVVDSTGAQVQSEADLADVALGVIEKVQNYPAIDKIRIGLLGISNGGWVAPVVATRSSVVKCVVLFSGPAVSPEQQEIFRLASVDRMRGASDDQIKKLTEARQIVYRYLATGEDRAAAQRVYERMQTESDLALLKQQSPPLPAELPSPEGLTAPRYSWYKPLYDFDPMKYLAKVQQPTFALYGANDPFVNAEESAGLLNQLKAQRPNWKLTVKIYPGAGHGLEQRDAHGPLHNPDAPSVAGFPADMVAWFKSQLGNAN